MAERALSIFIFKIVPTRLLSRIFGWVASAPLPRPVLNRVIRWFSIKFSIVDEYITPEGGFRTVDSFFTRLLKPGARKIDSSKASLVSPVDARVDQFGAIRGNTIIQAKGLDYSLKDLVPTEMARHFEDGMFAVLYLSPSDYHRIHSPVSGKITGYHIIPGRLLTVQEYMVKGLRGLFSGNERAITYIDTGKGMAAVIKVGAMNVGKITLSYADEKTNRFFGSSRERIYDEKSAVKIEKGDEVGIFHLGSTVILLFEKGYMEFTGLETGKRVVLGKPIGRVLK